MSETTTVATGIRTELLAGIPKSAKAIFTILMEAEGPLTPSDLVSRTGLTDRTIRSALQILYKLGLVIRVPNLNDMRSHFLSVPQWA
ncbi:MAG TPA: helix-turn-helix domain-containing protein [Candidatus Hodarchaeales archaeon]|nr:helix-turn-helix domain-containing protein [Candidatus Hodarchaeales archaeon]